MGIEETLAEYLDEATGIGWFHQVPASRPDEFGVVYRTGGGRGLAENSPLMTLKVWASTWKRARELSEHAAKAVRDAPFGIENAMSSTVLSVYDDPDDDSGLPRRRITAEMTFND